MEPVFNAAAEAVAAGARAGEVASVWFSAERSDFVRLNRTRVRQAGSVEQAFARVHLIVGRRHAESSLTLTGSPADDRALVAAALDELRDVAAAAPEDPHLVYETAVTRSRTVRAGRLPRAEEAVTAALDAAGDADLVGFYVGGEVFRGFASSLGQSHWHQVESFSLDWSLYERADKAIKTTVAGFEWSADELTRRMAAAREQQRLLARPAVSLAPGRYRAWLSPAAVSELTGMLSWGGFGGRARATRQSCLLRMQSGGVTLDPRVTLCENLAEGIAPRFQSDGFARPDRVALITEGRLGDALVSPRTAREFGLDHNGASAGESPEALDLAAGDIPSAEALARLGTGLLVGNLWYLNFSDRPACRVTGMTRFGTFWVEGGEVVGPVDVMRFDDSLLRLFGDRLEGLSREREFIPSSQTWHERAVDSARLPAMLVSELTLTL
jgi:predicted Zn-dependent protease